MSGVSKSESEHEQKASVIPLIQPQGTQTGPGGVLVERRRSNVRDRRAMVRPAHPELAIFLARIGQLCRIGLGFAFAFEVLFATSFYANSGSVSGSNTDLLAWWLAGGVFVTAIAVERFRRTIADYVRSESQDKLLRVAKSGFVVAIVFAVLLTVIASAHVVRLF